MTKRRGSCPRGGAQLLAKDFDTRAPHSCGIPLYYILEAMAAYAYSTEQALELLMDSSFENLDSGGEGDIEEDPCFPFASQSGVRRLGKRGYDKLVFVL